ncbi:Sushi, von Willebrand factor type A, EGF and pentraxin domain-containing protein 1 [Varanus komodoensis]|nr:Sushi, von Willebrand factor type A, EGF and pentraxin domain-containing protein 1 [Varanus komodoensis]
MAVAVWLLTSVSAQPDGLDHDATKVSLFRLTFRTISRQCLAKEKHLFGQSLSDCERTTVFTALGDHLRDAVCQSPCLNGGKCIRPNRCHCTSPWTGHDCSRNHLYFFHMQKYIIFAEYAAVNTHKGTLKENHLLLFLMM